MGRHAKTGAVRLEPEVRRRFEEVALPHVGALYRFALRLTSEAAAAEDLVQETGRTMKESHQNLHITEKEWDAMVADFRKVLDQHGVPAAEQDELVAIVGSTKADIVVAGSK